MAVAVERHEPDRATRTTLFCRRAVTKTFTRRISRAIAPPGTPRSSTRPRHSSARIWAVRPKGNIRSAHRRPRIASISCSIPRVTYGRHLRSTRNLQRGYSSLSSASRPARSSPRGECTAVACTRLGPKSQRRFLPATCSRASQATYASNGRKSYLQECYENSDHFDVVEAPVSSNPPPEPSVRWTPRLASPAK